MSEDIKEAANDLVPPEATRGDRGAAVVRSIVGAVPFAGQALQELFAGIVRTPLERRRYAWMESVGERLQRLEAVGAVEFSDLSANEAFVSVVVNATEAAVRTHDDAKLEALRNAVLNAACSHAPDDALQVQFVGIVDKLTGWHIRLLAYLRDPRSMLEADSPVLTAPLRDIVSGVEAAIPELSGKRDLILQLYEELNANRLLNHRSPKVQPGLTALAKRTSGLGDGLLDFIVTDPTPRAMPQSSTEPPA